MVDNELLFALSDLMDKKLEMVKQDLSGMMDSKLEVMDKKLEVMDRKLEVMDKKLDTTKQGLEARMDEMERNILNTCLGYTDDQCERILKRLDTVQSTVNTAARLKTIDNDVYNLVSRRIDALEERVEQLEKIS